MDMLSYEKFDPENYEKLRRSPISNGHALLQ